MDRSPTRRTPSPRTHKKTLSFRTGCVFFSLCRWYSSNLSDVTRIGIHPQRVWSMLPLLPDRAWRFHSLERIRQIQVWGQTWTWDLGWTCLYYRQKNPPNGGNVCHYLDWHRVGSISHSCALRWLVMPSIFRIAFDPTCQPPRMTSAIRKNLIIQVLGVHIWNPHPDKNPTCSTLGRKLKMRPSLGWSGHGASNSGSRSEICSLKNCVGLELWD